MLFSKMSYVNENLIRSMLCDLKEIINVSGDITSWVGDIECTSWRYPSKQSDSVDALLIVKSYTGAPDECYTQLLEMIYDRLHFALNLLVKFLDFIPVLSCQFALPKNVARPQSLSLGALLNMYWNRMQVLHENLLPAKPTITNRVVEEPKEDIINIISHDVINRSSQTEILLLDACENCHITEELIKRLVVEIEKSSYFDSSSAVRDERLRMKHNLEHITQWSALQSWATAIITDYTSLIKAIEEAHSKHKHSTDDLKAKQEVLEKKIQTMQSISDNFKVQSETLQVQLQKMERKNKLMNKTKEDLELKIVNMDKNKEEMTKLINENALSLTERKKHIEKVESRLRDATAQLERAEKENQKIVVDCDSWKLKCKQEIVNREESEKRLLENEEIMNKIKDLHKEETVKLQKKSSMEINKVQEKYSNLKRCLSDEKKASQSLQSANEQLRTTVSDAKADQVDLQSRVSQLESQLKTCKDREALLLEYPDVDCQVPAYKVHGNPIQDMEGQLQSNTLRIKLLEDQNTKLVRTIRKLKHLAVK